MSGIAANRILLEIDAAVASVKLNRSDKKNALDREMFEGLSNAADRISADRSIRAVVLHGAGDSFCAGIDLALLADETLDFRTALTTPRGDSAANFFQHAAYAWRELSVPVIAALRGVVFGGGLQVALGADVRFAAPDTRLSIMESNWGIVPDMGITTTLAGIVAADRIKQLAWTAQEIDAAEAERLGLVTAVVEDPLEAAVALARECAGRSPDAIQGIKKLVNDGMKCADRDALRLEAEVQAAVLGRPNQREAVAARLARRAPEFSDE